MVYCVTANIEKFTLELVDGFERVFIDYLLIEREAILEIHLNIRGQEVDNMDELVNATKDFSGHIEDSIKEAMGIS